jgi:hypothetical protein
VKSEILKILNDLDCQRVSVQSAYDSIMRAVSEPDATDEVIELNLGGSAENSGPLNWDRELEELR